MENELKAKRIFITLISEQTIPNLQYIKEFGQFDEYVFISTEKMEALNKSRYIQKASGIEDEKLRIMKVSEESYQDIIFKLGSQQFDKNANIVVNITLGTKIMSLALFDFFRSNKKAEIFYTPINTNKYIRIPDESIVDQFKYKVSIREYFTCYGISIASMHYPLLSGKYAESFFENFLEFKDFELKVIDDIRKFRGKGLKGISSIEGLAKLLNHVGFPIQTGNALSKHEVQYLTGGWFEEWVYFQLKEKYNLAKDQIALGVNVNATADNDLDVAFIKNNNLFVIECKTALGAEYQQSTLYKSGALIEKFGRAAKSYLLTLQNLRKPNGYLKDAIELRARQQNVQVYDRKDLLNFQNIKF